MPPNRGRQLLQSIESLSSNPRPRQSRKLKGSRSSYRMRVGDYRILYQVDDGEKSVVVFAVGHRARVY